MVSALDSGSGGPGSSPGRGAALFSWARYLTLIVPLSTQVNLLLGVTLRWTSIPSRGEHATETGISSGLMGPLARKQTLPYLFKYLNNSFPHPFVYSNSCNP